MPEKSVLDDPVAAETREVRRQLWEQAGGSVAGLIELVRRETASDKRPTRRKRPSAPRGSARKRT